MASSECRELRKIVSIMGDETTCPVCLEEFQEPKCLPSCAHNVCERCLENMVRKNAFTISCPQCREESFLPPAGVSSLPTNHLLLRLIENTPARKEKKAISEALNVCKERVKAAEYALQEMEECYGRATDQGKKLKYEINKLSDDLIQAINDQRKCLLSQLDNFLAEHFDVDSVQIERKNLDSFLKDAWSCMLKATEILQQGEISKLLESKDILVEKLKEISSTADERTLEAKRLSKQADMDFHHSPLIELHGNCVEMVGKLALSASNFANTVANAAGLIDYSRCGEVSETIVTGVSTFAMAVSNISGDIALLDEENRFIYIYSHMGDPICGFRIRYGDLWDVAFSKDDEIIVLNRECNRLLHYDREGTFIKKYVKAPNARVKFTRISSDVEGRLLVTSSPRDCCDEPEEMVEPCILVYSSDRKFQFSFGEDRLRCPQDVAFHQGKFFVTDGDLECVKVFSGRGNFLFDFGSGALLDPIGIAVDPINNVVLVCNGSSNAIVVFQPDGEVISEIETSDEPLHVALSSTAKSLIVCFHNTPFFKVLSNKEFC
ncbi:tripartite motif-containing protein 2-like [Montipora foliosa]|uniref:tripartite motif-containing protein 2-like n=1 Tax=Montipora foliosa TaxID=591990 RepID=UPI0035F189AE